jgi:hypothetical protein
VEVPEIVYPVLARAYYYATFLTREAVDAGERKGSHINGSSTRCPYQVNQSFDLYDGAAKATATGPGSLHSSPFKASKHSFVSVPKVVRGGIPLRCRPVVSFEIGP